jgi:tetratricopeptide (TPR) repeat protein/transcriptional regulator with XRE-family HTH domain
MATGDTLAFGDVLRHYRVLAGLTQEALAERARVSTQAIRALEQGINHAPRAATLALLAEALALSPQARAALVAAARQDTRAVRQAAAGVPTENGAAPPLAGRAPELALLEGHLAGNGPPLLLLAGEPGIGKSRLLQHTAQRAPAGGWRVLVGGCQRRGGQEPYAPLLQALARVFDGQTRARVRTMLRGCAWLVRLLPELAEGPIEPLPEWSVSPEQERRLIYRAVERFLANVAGPAGTVLVLDDLQWAGADALDLLATLVHPRSVPLRIVGAYRDTEVHPGDPLEVTLADLAHAGLVGRHLLSPLAPAEVHQLLDGRLDGRAGDRATLVTRIAQRTGGVPFFVLSCAQALRDETADAETIPWDVAQGIRQRVAVLPDVARAALGAAAIAVGRAVQAPVLAAVLEQPERAVLAALEAAWRARLVDHTDGDYRIAHDLIREVLEADLGPARRALHRRTAEALVGRAGPAEVLAYHFVRGDAPDRAVAYLEQAGDQAQAQHGRAAAEGYYREAVEWLERLGRALDAARVREKLGSLLRTGGRPVEALAALEPAVDAYRAAADLEAAGRVVAVIAGVHVDRGTPTEGLARLEPVLALLAERGPSRTLAALYTTMANLFFMQGRLREDLAATEQGERIARLVGDDHSLADALYKRGNALLFLGRPGEALQPYRAGIAVAEAAGAAWSQFWAMSNMGLAQQELGAFVAARQSIARALHLAERQGFRSAVAVSFQRSAGIAFLTGDWGAARRDFERAAAEGREVGVFFGSVLVPVGLGLLALAEGAYAEASEHLAECERLLQSAHDANAGLGIVVPLVAGALAKRDLLAGRPDQARARLAPLIDPDTRQADDVAPLLRLMAWALLDLGEVDEAAEAAWQTVRWAQDTGRQVLLVDALRVAALVATRQGRRAEAEGAIEEGLSLARQMGYPYGEARLLLVYGELQVQAGQPQSARERLEAALAIVRRLGACVDRERVEQVLASLG